MERYTILTYLFGDYEILREPRVVSDNCDYICVTDNRKLSSDVWRFVYVNRSDCREDWVNAYLAKNNFLHIVDSDVIIRIDGSIQVLKNCDNIVKDFIRDGYDMGVMVHPKRNNVMDEYDAWIKKRGLNEKCKGNFVRESFFAGIDEYSNGLVESGFVICRRNAKTITLFDEVISYWTEANIANRDRLEQAWLTLCAKKYQKDLNLVLYYGRQCINSDYFQIFKHGSWKALVNKYDYDNKRIYLFGRCGYELKLL